MTDKELAHVLIQIAQNITYSEKAIKLAMAHPICQDCDSQRCLKQYWDCEPLNSMLHISLIEIAYKIANSLNTLEEIKQAIDNGKRVCWMNAGYRVIKISLCQYMIIHQANNGALSSAVMLTHLDGVTMNENPKTFYIHC